MKTDYSFTLVAAIVIAGVLTAFVSPADSPDPADVSASAIVTPAIAVSAE